LAPVIKLLVGFLNICSLHFTEIAILSLYTLCLLFVLLYSLEQLDLAITYWKNNHKNPKPQQNLKINTFPKVTIQLPVYNEKYVVKRLLKHVCSLDYPKEKLQIQILDDSTDETSEIIKKEIKQYPEINIEYIHRKNRKGYKAGALKNGLRYASGEFIALFDADFMPGTDFLKKTIPYFENPNVGMVQTRWAHSNKHYSLLTQLQAFGLDAHFKVEQTARKQSSAFINFNGTAGVWRKKCITDSGNWQSDTLTEDLDLSYRAQLKGWSFIYLPHTETPAELPITVQALKNQQFRWTKGAAECAKKHLINVLRNKSLGFTVKKHAFFHLLNSSVYLCILFITLFSIPVFLIKIHHPEWKTFFNLISVSLLSFVFFGVFYFFADENKKSFWWKYPLFLSVSMGLLAHNSLAVLEAFLGKKTPFIRTPKFNLDETKHWTNNQYSQIKISLHTILEWFLLIYAIYGIIISFKQHDFSFLAFWLMLCFGLGFLTIKNLWQWATINYLLLKTRKLKAKTIV
jgi:cellulose synthase/poly-beta-1,6-N-acetylglucosamine synthase-like glycosyltransferase